MTAGADPRAVWPAWPTGQTALAGVVGDPVRHSMSPSIFNAAFDAAGIDWTYVAFPVAAGELSSLVQAMKIADIRGLSVTTPHKHTAAEVVDSLSPVAAALGAVNVIVAEGEGRTRGESTDGPGFVEALRARCSFDPEGTRCVVLGAGGAARAIVAALADSGALEVVVVNRSADRAHAAAALAGRHGRVGVAQDAEAADLVVQATTVGMDGVSPPAPGAARYLIDPFTLGPGQLAIDIVYHPRDTPFLVAAREAGAETADGVGMLVHQAALAFTLWTGVEAPIDVMDAAAARNLLE